MGLLTRPLAFVGTWLSDHPFSLAGGLAAVGGSVATYVGVGPGATLADVTAYVSAHPAYAVAVVLGLAALLFYDG